MELSPAKRDFCNPTTLFMYYLNFVHTESGDVMHTAPVGPEERDYLEQVIETLRPLTNGEYLDGPAYILSTLASFSLCT